MDSKIFAGNPWRVSVTSWSACLSRGQVSAIRSMLSLPPLPKFFTGITWSACFSWRSSWHCVSSSPSRRQLNLNPICSIKKALHVCISVQGKKIIKKLIMKIIDRIYHLVHLWCDQQNHPLLEQNIIAEFQKINQLNRQWLCVVLNFVDSPFKYSLDSIELSNLFGIARCLQLFIDYNYSPSLSYQEYIDLEKSKDNDIPSILLKEFYSNDILINIFNSHKNISSAPKDNKLATQEWYYSEIMSTVFLDVLLQIWRKYKHQNIFWFNPQGFEPFVNPSRRLLLQEMALQIVWKEYIINSEFHTDDMTLKYWLRNFEMPSYIQLHQIEYGNAYKFISWNKARFHASRLNSYRDNLLFFLEAWWFKLDGATKHILCGEYLWRCLCNYWDMLHYWQLAEDQQLFVSFKNSIVNPCDDEFKIKENLRTLSID